MSEEQLKAFLEKVKGDITLQQKLKSAADAVVVAAIAKEAGFSISADEITHAKPTYTELSDNDIESLVGGNQDYCMLTIGGNTNGIYQKCSRKIRVCAWAKAEIPQTDLKILVLDYV